MIENIKDKARKYDRLLKIVWDDLIHSIRFRRDRPGEKNPYVGLNDVRYYQEIAGLVVKYVDNPVEQFDLEFLRGKGLSCDESVRDLSEKELEDWKLKVAELRGWLKNICEGEE